MGTNKEQVITVLRLLFDGHKIAFTDGAIYMFKDGRIAHAYNEQSTVGCYISIGLDNFIKEASGISDEEMSKHLLNQCHCKP